MGSRYDLKSMHFQDKNNFCVPWWWRGERLLGHERLLEWIRWMSIDFIVFVQWVWFGWVKFYIQFSMSRSTGYRRHIQWRIAPFEKGGMSDIKARTNGCGIEWLCHMWSFYIWTLCFILEQESYMLNVGLNISLDKSHVINIIFGANKLRRKWHTLNQILDNVVFFFLHQ